MKKVKLFSILLMMLVSTVTLYAQALTQSYDRMGLQCRYPAEFNAISETIEDGITVHLFADDIDMIKNAMVVMEIKHQAIEKGLEEAGLDYVETLNTFVEALQEGKSENLDIEKLAKELELELQREFGITDWSFEKWNLQQLNLYDVNLHEMSLEDIAGEMVNKVVTWGVDGIYNVIYDIIYQAIKLGLSEQLTNDEDLNLKITNIDNNSIELLVWDADNQLNFKLNKEDNTSLILKVTGVVEEEYAEANIVLYKKDNNTLALSAKVAIEDITLDATASLSKIDDKTFALSIRSKELGELIDDDLSGIQYAKGVIKFEHNKIILTGWMGQYYGIMNTFEEMYRTLHWGAPNNTYGMFKAYK